MTLHHLPLRSSAVPAITRAKALICLLALASTPLMAADARQIHLNAEQLRRSGIQTAPVSVADGKSAVPSASVGVPNQTTNQAASGQFMSGTVIVPVNALSLVSSHVSGVVQQVHVYPLQTVQAATPVASIFSQQLMEMQRDYLQLATQARLSKDKAQRDEALFKEGIIAQARLQESQGQAIQTEIAAKERYQSLRAGGLADAQIKQLLSNHALVPTFTVAAGGSGTIVELEIHPGQRVEAGMPLAKISKDVPLWVEVQATRQQADKIRTGDLLYVKGCAPLRVMAISPQLTGGNQATLIRAQQEKRDACLKPNQFVEVSHSIGSNAAGSIGIPATALVQQGADTFVFLKNTQGFEAVKVQQVSGSADKVWVTEASGKLKAGAEVAVKGIVAIKGAWIGLGADEAPATAPAVPVTSAASAAAHPANTVKAQSGSK
ncbi:efflux RND transporter periplasmic adaptor subunit [Undibacterium sp. SXout7W]|uniref:efflux RND transporter periplasmic adaptor subunit n=1 Tax=Undibacterium sp. SXout7W TaxID=3413049 RepID=UPI003BF177FA